ncbi:Protein VAC14-like protein [Hypsibius exemplaris]|uniref:Protein VAC14 homolog n=1 Tax=Hypsibius exemplaris TaxID=2072580 RepID=A0A1W0WIU7_HYPEX|nr:Protein VAC14-like protein [Hypsibius exemplaris]
MTDQDLHPLNQNLLRLLTEKIYEKRKTAALEVERMMKDYVLNGNTAMIQKLIKVLAQDLTLSDNSNYRKGGLIGLAAASIALGKQIRSYIPQIIQPVLSCFNDSDSRIRYFACEALYNVVKVARDAAMPYFSEVFDVLSKLCADSDTNTKNGAELLDRLVKDVVIESKSFNLETFVPLLRERIYARNPFVRQFLVSWIAVLDSVPEIDILHFLPEILDGLFVILSDPRLEIRKACESVLGEFLHGIVNRPGTVDYPAMVNILITHSQSPDELVQFTAVLWIKQFIKLAGPKMLPFTSGLLVAILPCLSLESESRKNIRENARQVNQELVKIIPAESEAPQEATDDILTLDLESIVQVLIDNMTHSSIPTRLAALRWVYSLLDQIPRRTFKSIEKLFPAVLKALEDDSDEVIMAALEDFAEIRSVSDQFKLLHNSAQEDHKIQGSYFRRFIRDLLTLFKKDRQILDDRGHFMIRQLCLLLSAEEIYSVVADILVDETDPVFASAMVEALSAILLTASELFELRASLRKFDRKLQQGHVFTKLYRCWAHNSVATVSLCLLAQQYQHASDLLGVIADLDVTVEHLAEIDKLVQLIESPIFTHLRMQLLDPETNAYLVRTLYGLLMLLPQSEAFENLRRRLDCVPLLQRVSQGQSVPPSDMVAAEKAFFADLLQYFINTQKRQQASIRHDRKSHS